MLTFQISRTIESTLRELFEGRDFLNALNDIRQVFEAVTSDVLGIATNTSNAGYANQMFSTLNGLGTRLSGVSPRKVYSAVETIRSALNHFEDSLDFELAYAKELKGDIEQFASLYDAYLSNQNAENAAKLVLISPIIQVRLNDFYSVLSLFNDVLEESPIDLNREYLSVVLGGQLNLKDFIFRLDAIQSMYSELCQLLAISEVDHPLQIAKIESGSLWAKVLGSSVVIGLMVHFIQSSATYAYRNFTTEGKVATIPAKVDSLDKVLDLRQKLKAAGIQSKEMDESLAKSAYAIAKDLNTLLENQSSIVVNGEQLSVAKELSHHQIGERKALKLTNR